MILSIIFFIFILISLGYAVYALSKIDIENRLERIIIILSFGLGTLVVLTNILHLLHLPQDWRIYLLLSLIFPIASIRKFRLSPPMKEFKINKSTIYGLFASLLGILLLVVYLNGSFTYDYLEDDDPWNYVSAGKYVSQEKTAWEPINHNFRYIDPAPISYSTIMGVLHQTNDSISWTFKFFNSFLIALSILFFYYFALEFTKNKNKAIFSTFIITILPSFMSHFIWAQSLAIPLMFPAFYCLLKLKEDKKWRYPGSILIGAILLSHVYVAIVFGGMVFIFLACQAIQNSIKATKQTLITILSGLIISSFYWVTMLITKGLNSTLSGVGFSISKFTKATVDTSSGLIYNLNDFIIAPLQSKMDQPTGLGIFVFIILVITLIVSLRNIKKVNKNMYLKVSTFWLIFTFIGLQSNAFPIKLFPHRFWVFFAIPVALLVGDGLFTISKSLKNKKVRYALLSILFIGILWTSAYPKYVVETGNWPAGASWTSYDEINGYLWLKTLPPDTKVFTYNVHDQHIIGLDKYSCSWCKEVVDFRENILEKDINELYTFLKGEKYKYLVISGMSYKYLGRKFGETKAKEKINEILRDIQNSTKFSAAHQTNGAIIFKIL